MCTELSSSSQNLNKINNNNAHVPPYIHTSIYTYIHTHTQIIAIKLQAEPINILMIQVYMPTSEHENDEVEELYGVIEEILEKDGRGNTNTIIMGDWNSAVGDEPYRNIVGPHGLRRKNQRPNAY